MVPTNPLSHKGLEQREAELFVAISLLNTNKIIVLSHSETKTAGVRSHNA